MRPHLRKAIASIGISFACVAALAGAGQPTAAPKPAPKVQPAAEPAKPEMLQITVLGIKPELVTEWLEFQKSETIPMLKKAGCRGARPGRRPCSATDRCTRS